MNKITFLIFTSLIITACTSQPYVRFKTPNIDGSLLVNDSPAQGVLIYLSLDASDSECQHYVQRTQTDEQGRFSLPAEKVHMDYTPLMTHYLDEWIVCADVQGVRRVLHSNNRYGMGSVPHTMTLDCRINTQVKNDHPCQQPLRD